MIEREYTHDGNYVNETVITKTGQEVDKVPYAAYRKLYVNMQDGQIVNDDTDTETVSVEVVDGLEVVKGTDPANATVLDYNGDVTLTVDGAETTKTLSSGSVSFDITTTKSAGETIEVVAQDLMDHPAESDSATIEVTN